VGPRIGVIGLVPARRFARFLEGLRARYPQAALTAIIGSPELRVGDAAQEYLLWGELGARGLVREVRRRRLDLLVLAYNRDYAGTLTYWKALALVLVSRAGGLLFCEDARLPDPASLQALGRPRALAHALLGTAWTMVAQPLAYLAREAAIIALSLPLGLVLLAIVAVDLADASVGALTRRRRNLVRQR